MLLKHKRLCETHSHFTHLGYVWLARDFDKSAVEGNERPGIDDSRVDQIRHEPHLVNTTTTTWV